MAIYVIECAGPQNENFMFAPERVKVRGRWDSAKIAHRDLDEVMKQITMLAPIIPGQYIILDTAKNVGSILDPLGGTQEGKQILDKLKGVYKQYQEVTGGDTSPVPAVNTQLDHDGVKNWAYAMRRLLDAKNAVQVTEFKGAVSLPPLEEIATWPGKRLADPLNSGEQTAKNTELGDGNNFLYKYADEVPVSKSNKAKSDATKASESSSPAP